MIDFAKLLLRI